jgi:type I restriction enzyme, S subunit
VNFETLPFHEIFSEKVKNGIYKSKDYIGFGIPLIRMKEMFAFDLIRASGKEFELIELTATEKLKVLLQDGDLLFARTSVDPSGVGKCAIVFCGDDEITYDSNIIRVRLESTKSYPPYYCYYFMSSMGKKLIQSIAGGAAITTIKGSDLVNLSVPVPPLETQRKIASVLSAYDDLIETNTKRIQALEESAQALYREWFVEFRFPGHEDVELVESELGMIPEGWEVGVFTDVAEVLSGGTPKTKIREYWDGDIPFFTPRDAVDSFYVMGTDKHLTQEGLKNGRSPLYPPDTIFITARGTVGKVRLPSVPMTMNQSCYALVGHEGFPQYFVFMMIKNYVEYLQQKAHGAVFDTIIVDTFNRLDVIIPLPQIGMVQVRLTNKHP